MTTASTAGYGDYTPFNSFEKTYYIFFEFAGIAMFSMISGRIS
jgi:hypothetical protein